MGVEYLENVEVSNMRLTVGTRGKQVALVVTAVGHGANGGDAVLEVDLSPAEAREVARELIKRAGEIES
jgi:NAD(P)H-hydrate repair Nnr-like enzyme with NAD(P)H-hydrate epimerase domain